MIRVVEVVITLASGKARFTSLFELCNIGQDDRDLRVATIKRNRGAREPLSEEIHDSFYSSLGDGVFEDTF